MKLAEPRVYRRSVSDFIVKVEGSTASWNPYSSLFPEIMTLLMMRAHKSLGNFGDKTRREVEMAH